MLPDPIVNISLNREVLQQMGVEGLLTLPAWCSRVSEIVKNMSLLVANLTHVTENGGERSIVEGMMEGMKGLKEATDSLGNGQSVVQEGREVVQGYGEPSDGCRVPHIGSYSRARRERVEKEIRNSGVSVRSLRSNFEGQIGSMYPFAGMMGQSRDFNKQLVVGASGNKVKTNTGLNHEVRRYDSSKKLLPVMETTSLRKERIVVLFLSHWKRSAYVISRKAARLNRGKEAATGGMTATPPQHGTAAMVRFCQKRGAVDKILNSWRNKLELKGSQTLALSSSHPSKSSPSHLLTYTPEQFVPDVDGVAMNHDDLTLDLFMLGYFHILEQDLTPEERKMRHLLCFEVFDHVGSFPWETVRDFHKAVLKEIQGGERRWSAGFDDIKCRFFGDSKPCGSPPTMSSTSLPDPRSVPVPIIQTAARQECGSDTDLSCFNKEDVCKYIDRSFAFWKEKEAELFDFEL